MQNMSITKGPSARRAVVMLGLRGERVSRFVGVAVCLLTVAALSGCTSLRPVELTDAKDLIGHVKVDDRLRVTLSGGTALSLKVTAVRSDEIVGKTLDGKERTIEAMDIEQIERRVPAPGKTAALAGTLGALYAAYAVASAYGAILSGL